MKYCVRITFCALLLLSMILSSCSNNNYVDAIPARSSGLMYFDVKKMGDEGSKELLKTLFPLNDVSSCGINFDSRIYAFLMHDNNFGLCAEVADADQLKATIEKESGRGHWSKPTKQGDINYSVLDNSWVVGFTDNTLLMMGPIAVASQQEAKRKIKKYLNNDDENSITSTKMYLRLSSMQSSVGFSFRCSEVPDFFADPLTVIVPKDVNTKNVFIASSVDMKDSCLIVESEAFSPDENINKTLTETLQQFETISKSYVERISNHADMALIANTKGTTFLPLLKNKKSIQALLTGMNTAIDMDNILQSISGNMFVELSSINSNDMKVSIAAEIGHSKWLKDVDYWKQSCTDGASIKDWKQNAYCYSSGKTSLYFGVDKTNQFYAGSTADMATASLGSSSTQLSPTIQNEMVGKKLCWMFNISAISNSLGSENTEMTYLSNLSKRIKFIIYSIK